MYNEEMDKFKEILDLYYELFALCTTFFIKDSIGFISLTPSGDEALDGIKKNLKKLDSHLKAW